MILIFCLIGAVALAAGITAFYKFKMREFGVALTVVALIAFSVATICSFNVHNQKNSDFGYVPIVVTINGETYSGNWYPNEQKEFLAYKDDDFTKCVVGRIYNVGYGPYDEGD